MRVLYSGILHSIVVYYSIVYISTVLSINRIVYNYLWRTCRKERINYKFTDIKFRPNFSEKNRHESLKTKAFIPMQLIEGSIVYVLCIYVNASRNARKIVSAKILRLPRLRIERRWVWTLFLANANFIKNWLLCYSKLGRGWKIWSRNTPGFTSCTSSLEDIYEALKDESTSLVFSLSLSLSISLSLWSFSSLNRLNVYSTACYGGKALQRVQSRKQSWSWKVGRLAGSLDRSYPFKKFHLLVVLRGDKNEDFC